MSKHTPGPWLAKRAKSGEMVQIASDGWSKVADVYHPVDARLIAAAPDLLEALKGAAEVIDACVRNTATVPIPGISRIMRAAIAKAEGK